MRVFVSYAGADRQWAQWAAAVLEAAGLVVELDVWDWLPGDNVVVRMNQALDRADAVLVLWSAAYFASDRFTLDEWTALEADRPDVRKRKIPVRIDPVTPPPTMRPIKYQDLTGLDEPTAQQTLLRAVTGAVPRTGVYPATTRRRAGPGNPTPPRDAAGTGPQADSAINLRDGSGQEAVRPEPALEPDEDPGAPVGVSRLPGVLPAVWNVRARDLSFTGRRAALAALRSGLDADGRTVVHAVGGQGGVGKTSVAVEYAYLFAGEYDLAWWVDAEQPALIGDQIARLAVTAGWAGPGVAVDVAWDAARRRLRGRGGWLLVFDNVTAPGDVYQWIPAGAGHVVVTSRARGFAGWAVPVDVDVMPRPESIDLLRNYLPALTPPDADRLAAALGDLPLALAQAGTFLTQTLMPITDYLTELQRHASEVLAHGTPLNYPLPLATAIQVSLDRLIDLDPAAAQVLRLAAVLAPDPLPVAWLTNIAAGVGDPAQSRGGALADDLAAIATRPVALRRTCSRIADLGLGSLSENHLQIHRLTQAVLRDTRTPGQLSSDYANAAALVAANEPGDDGTDPSSWQAWASIMPHLLALDPAASPTGDPLRHTACNALWYLISSGQVAAALPIAEACHTRWLHTSIADDKHVLRAANQLAVIYGGLGRQQEAHDLAADTYARRRRLLGPDHPDTLTSANNLAIRLAALGCHQKAHDLAADTYARRRRLLGPDHPKTLTSANTLAIRLAGDGRRQAAHDLNIETLERRRRVLGEDHPKTLTSAYNLADCLAALDLQQEAHDLDSDTLKRRRRVLGEDHPSTLNSAHNLALRLTALGQHQQAHDLAADTLERRRRILGEDHPRTLATARSLAVNLTELGRHQQAH